jgi:hypothetical protein
MDVSGAASEPSATFLRSRRVSRVIRVEEMLELRLATATLALLAAISGCKETPPPPARPVPIHAAYEDGFRIVVVTRQPGTAGLQASAPKLAAGEALLRERADATAALPADQLDAMKELLERSRRASPESAYPFVTLTVDPAPGHQQVVSVWYHYSLGTEGYSYQTDGKTVRPLWSSDHRPGRYDRVAYTLP